MSKVEFITKKHWTGLQLTPFIPGSAYVDTARMVPRVAGRYAGRRVGTPSLARTPLRSPWSCLELPTRHHHIQDRTHVRPQFPIYP